MTKDFSIPYTTDGDYADIVPNMQCLKNRLEMIEIEATEEIKKQEGI